MNHLLICDLDGTLADTRQDLTSAVNRMRTDFNLPPLSLETVVSYVGDGTRKLAERALAGTGISIDDALPVMKKHYQEFICVDTKLYPGVKEGLERFFKQADWRLAVLTNKPQAATDQLLERLGIVHLFHAIIGGGNAFPLKPEPEAIFHLMSEADTVPETTWMLGDNHTDLAAGRNAGIHCCFAAWGFGSRNREESDLTAETFSEMVGRLLR